MSSSHSLLRRADYSTSRVPPILVFLLSALIVFVVGLQALITFRVLCPPEAIRPLAFLRAACAPALYPFIDYPMYWTPHYQGESISQPMAVGILADGREVLIQPEDLNLHFWLHQEFLVALDQGVMDEIELYVKRYQDLQGVKLAGIRLENHPVSIDEDGIQTEEVHIMREYFFETSASVP